MIHLHNPKLKVSEKKIEAFCKKWKVKELLLFGSVLTKDFRPDSDVDILVAFAEDASWGLLDHEKMRDELTSIFDREVDLVSKKAVERSRNPIRRRAILRSAKLYYVA